MGDWYKVEGFEVRGRGLGEVFSVGLESYLGGFCLVVGRLGIWWWGEGDVWMDLEIWEPEGDFIVLIGGYVLCYLC